MRPGILRRSTSVQSDGTGEVPMEKLAEGGKQKRVRGLLVSQSSLKFQHCLCHVHVLMFEEYASLCLGENVDPGRCWENQGRERALMSTEQFETLFGWLVTVRAFYSMNWCIHTNLQMWYFSAHWDEIMMFLEAYCRCFQFSSQMIRPGDDFYRRPATFRKKETARSLETPHAAARHLSSWKVLGMNHFHTSIDGIGPIFTSGVFIWG